MVSHHQQVTRTATDGFPEQPAITQGRHGSVLSYLFAGLSAGTGWRIAGTQATSG